MRYISPVRSVFSLPHLQGLGDEAIYVLQVSARTLYLIQNFVQVEAQQPQRYAVSFDFQSYQEVSEGDDLYDLFKSVRAQAELETVEVNLSGPIYGIDYAELNGAQHLSIPSTPYELEIDPVPEGEVWELQAFAARDTTGSPGRVVFKMVDGAGEIEIERWDNPEVAKWVHWQGKLMLSEGQFPAVEFGGSVVGHAVTFYVWYAKLV